MVKVKNVKIERKRELFLQPGGKHLMLFNLKKKLNDKDSFTLEIQQKNNKILETTIMVLNKKLKDNFLN
jgi:copper(I)-binding protein